MSRIILSEQASAPSTPSAGKVALYFKTDGAWYFKDDAGTEHALSGIPESLLTAKGDLLVASASGVVGNLSVGSNGQVLSADSAEILGVKWVDGPSIVQSKYAELLTYTDISASFPGDDTIPQNTEGTEVLTLAITPKATTNLLRVRALFWAFNNVNSTSCTSAIFRDAIANAKIATVSSLGSAQPAIPICLEHQEIAGSIAATTFKLRVGATTGAHVFLNGSSTGRLFGGVSKVTLTIDEIAG